MSFCKPNDWPQTIHWKRDSKKTLAENHLTWNEKVDELTKAGYIENKFNKSRGYKTNPYYWQNKTWIFDDDKDKNIKTIYICHNILAGDFEIYYCYLDESKGETSGSGYRAFKQVSQDFKERTGQTLKKAFGVINRSTDDSFLFDNCNRSIPAWIEGDDRIYGQELDHVFKADMCSAYPSALAEGPLPNANEMRIVEGQVEPQDWEVAYWIRSGHVIEGRYKGADTRKFRFSNYSKHARFKEIAPEDDITVLMPYNEEVSLAPEMEKLFDAKTRGDPESKQAMVAFIGYLRSTKIWQRHYMGHITALVYARQLRKMIIIDETLRKEGSAPIMYATDAVIWRGDNCKLTSNEKALGNFYLEYEDCRFWAKGLNFYGIEDKDGHLKTYRHQGSLFQQEQKPKNLTEFIISVSIKEKQKFEYYDTVEHKFKLKDKITYGGLI